VKGQKAIETEGSGARALEHSRQSGGHSGVGSEISEESRGLPTDRQRLARVLQNR
jgi:hypothetical protein